MAYLAPFESDFFVSYAHDDDEPPPDVAPQKGWVTRFERRLVFELKRLVGPGVAVWRDETALRRTEGFHERIKDALERSAFLVVLTSRSSLRSKYCAEEIAHFTQKVERGDALPSRLGAAGAGRRIVHVLLDKIEHTEWPTAVQGTNPFEFYETDDAGEAVGPIDPGGDGFRTAMNKLKRELRDLLAEASRLGCREPTPPVRPDRTPIPLGSVFLAEVEPEYEPLRTRIKDELVRRRKDVVESPEAAVSIHLFGPRPNPPAQAQFDASRSAGARQVIWLHKDVALPGSPGDAYLAWLHEVERSRREADRSTLIRGGTFKAAAQILEAVEAFSPPAPAETPAILIHAHERDKDAAYAAWEYLMDHNVRARLDHYADGPTRSRFEDLVREASGLVVFFGDVNWEWVKSRIRQAYQAAPDTLKTMSVCLAPPAPPDRASKRPSEVPKWLHLLFVDNANGFDPSAWEETLAAVAQ
jgi:hypothetical protein